MNKESFLSRVEKTDSCWIWKQYKNPSGYGLISIRRIREYAHRYSYQLFKGQIPEKYTIDHLCRNTSCVNPDHLEAVTLRENQSRGNVIWVLNAKKTHCPHGHEYNKDNTFFSKSGDRLCRRCSRIEGQRYQKRKWLECIEWGVTI